jgi:hypothetical protein
MPVPVPDDTLGGLDLGVGLPVPLARAFLVPWSAKQNAKAGDLRTLDAWCATAVAALCGEWSDDKAAFRRTAGADPADDPELASRARQKADAEAAAGERVRRDREALAARLGASAPSLEAAKDTVRNLASGDRP